MCPAAGGGAELDVVTPERVGLEKIHLLEPAGEARRGSLRRPRALPLPLPLPGSEEEEEEEEAAVLLLRLPTSGSELYVHLRRDPRFLAPGFAVEEWGEPGLARSRPPELPDCFYTGHVLNRTDSFASLSTCAGLVLPCLVPGGAGGGGERSRRRGCPLQGRGPRLWSPLMRGHLAAGWALGSPSTQPSCSLCAQPSLSGPLVQPAPGGGLMPVQSTWDRRASPSQLS